MFLSGHKAQKIWGEGVGAKSVLSYGALASHTHRPQSSFNRFIQSFCTINSPTRHATITKKPCSLYGNFT